MLRVEIWNLDNKEDVIFTISYKRKGWSLSHAELLRMLEANEVGTSAQPKTGRTLASLGKMIGFIRRDRPNALTEDDCQRLIAAMRSFDGNIANKRSSQVGRWLRELSQLESASDDLKATIGVFLDRYPQLEVIPKRKK